MLVTRNPVRCQAPIPAPGADRNLPVLDKAPDYWLLHPTPANLNTSDFAALWRAYWCVMADPTGGDGPRNGNADYPVWPAFRSTARGQEFVTNPFRSTEMLMHRSAISAANTIALREGGDDIGTDVIPSYCVRLSGKPDAPYAAIYGLKRQPFITSCMIQRGTNSLSDFVAIELYNPNPTPAAGTSTITLGPTYRFAILDRSDMSMHPIGKIGNGPVISYGGYRVLWDGHLPNGVTLPEGAVKVPGLTQSIEKELVLLRTRDPSTFGKGTMMPAKVDYDEGSEGSPNCADMVPLDQLNLVSAVVADGVSTSDGDKVRYSYSRFCSFLTWACACAGPYSQDKGHQLWKLTNPASDPQVDSNPFNGFAPWRIPDSHVVLGRLVFDTPPGFVFPPGVEVNPFGHVGPSPYHDSTPSVYPFGGFARAGDVAMVSYLGSYRISTSDGRPIEFNSVTIDAVGAVDQQHGSGSYFGHFWPYDADVQAWCASVREYLSVLAPQDDYLPNVAPFTNASSLTAAYPVPPQPVPNGPAANPAQANNGNEWSTGVNGLVNINTASWKVLSMLPLAMGRDGRPDSLWNDGVAWGYTYERHIWGPWQMQTDPSWAWWWHWWAPEFHGWGPITPTPFVPDDSPCHGELMLSGGDTSSRANALFLIRNSNLMTTRSDTFTAYILVQGWRNAGTPNATLEVQRRACFYLDRTGMTAQHPVPVAIPIPTQQ